MNRAVAVAVVVGSLTGGGGAAAHGGIPRAYDVLVEPGNPGHLVLPSLVWGALSSPRWTV